MLQDHESMHSENEELEEDVSWKCHLVDDSLDYVTKLEKYHDSSITSQRIVLLHDFSESVQKLGIGVAIEKLLPIFMKFASDNVPAVRIKYLTELKQVAEQFLGTCLEDARLEVFRVLIPSCFDLTVDESNEVSSSAIETIVGISAHLDLQELEQSIIEIANLYAHDDRDEECRIVAIQIFSRLSRRLSEPQLNLLITELVNLGDDMSCYVRCTVVRNLWNVMEALGGRKAYEALFQLFKGLCRDEIVEVRIACAENFIQIIKTIDCKEHFDEIYEYLSYFLDSEHAVRTPVLRAIGDFISLFDGDKLPKDIIERFSEIPYYDDMNIIAESCAQSFHKVLRAIGTSRWVEIASPFAALLENTDIRVKIAIAEQLHLLAQQFPPHTAYEFFSEIFVQLLDSEDEVKVIVVGNAHLLAEAFPESGAHSCICMIIKAFDGAENWRFRDAAGTALGRFLNSQMTQAPINEIIQLSESMLRDPVATVRSTGTSLIAQCFQCLNENGRDTENLCTSIMRLADAKSFMQRILFVNICEKLRVISPDTFDTHLLARVIELSKDAVPNVRISCANLIVLVYNENRKNNPFISECIEQLATDADDDVRVFAQVNGSDGSAQ